MSTEVSTPAAVEAPVESAAPAEQTPASSSTEAPKPQLVKVKVDGQIVELPLEEVTAGYQKISAANKRLAEAAQERKKIEAEFQDVQRMKAYMLKNPTKALREFGVDQKDLLAHYEEVLWEQIQEEKRSPEEKEAIKAKREIEALRQEHAALLEKLNQEESRKKEDALNKEIEKQTEEYSRQILDTLQKVNIPVTDEVVLYMTEKMSAAIDEQVDLSFEDIAHAYKQDRELEARSLLSKLSVEQLMELLGEDRMKQVRAKDVANLKNPTPEPTLNKGVKPQSSSSKKQSMSEYFKELEKIQRK
jgi:thiaminase